MQLEVRDIKKSFGDKEVLHGISFTVESGRAMGFLGRNGGQVHHHPLPDGCVPPGRRRVLPDGRPLNIKKHRVAICRKSGMYQKQWWWSSWPISPGSGAPAGAGAEDRQLLVDYLSWGST